MEANLSSPEVVLANRRRLTKAITPLRSIFWGGLLCILDFNVFVQLGNQRSSFDILNDALGMMLIAGGVIVLAAQKVDPLYDWLMSSVSAVAFVFTVGAFVKQLQPEFFLRVQPLMPFFRVIGLASTVAFCVSMHRLSGTLSAWTIERSWKITCSLFVFCVLVPGVILATLTLLVPTGAPLVAYSTILVIPGFLVAFVHLFLSTSRMAAFARAHEPTRPQRSVV